MDDEFNHLSISKPPIAGDPIRTASVTMIPKTIPTKIKRLFILKIILTQIKMKCLFNVIMKSFEKFMFYSIWK